VINKSEYNLLLKKCRELPPAEGYCLVEDYIENLLLTVLDYQIAPEALNQDMDYFRTHRRQEITELSDLKQLMDKYPDDLEGNNQLAEYLWNKKYWNRAGLLRKLVSFFEAKEITSQDRLKDWAQNTTFEDFKGRVSGLSYVLYQRLIMRQGIETLKPDTHIMDFVNSVLDRSETDHQEIAAKLTAVAGQLGIPAYNLDWRIWENQMDIISNGQMTVKT